MKVLLLGATGLLGHNVLQKLLAAGYDVSVLVRHADGIKLPGGGWQTFVGSPLDYATLLNAAKGCDAVMNCAGVTDMSLLRLEDYLPVNCELPKLIVRVMEEHGISTLVHTSTVNTIGYGSVECPATESEPMKEPFKSSYYAQSKRMGEEIVRSASLNHPNGHYVIINPGYMLGAWDVKPSSGRMLQMAYNKRVAFAPRGGKAFVAVRDVAEAEVNALTKGVNGERYIVTNRCGNLAIRELYEMQARVMGYRQRVVELPDFVLSCAGYAGGVLRECGACTELSYTNVSQLMVREFYDNTHGIKDLGYKETPIEQAIAEYHEWKNNNK